MTQTPALRFGWTTGACATAASKAAYTGLLTGQFPDPVEICLPRGQCVAFALAESAIGIDCATAAIVKDAGDDPDVTHGALIRVIVRPGVPGSGVVFRAGDGVGTVTRPGLPIPPGQPAINPVPRQMICDVIREVAESHAGTGDVTVEIAIPGGADIARQTLNARLGIVGGLSILGTTGVVVPYSCAAWIHSIHRGIDVARAAGLVHVAGSTGRVSEQAVQRLFDLPDTALIDMGDFVGGMLKYLRRHPVSRVTVAGGLGKLTKLSQGRLDLHSRRGAVDLPALADMAGRLGASDLQVANIRGAMTAAEAFAVPGVPLGDCVATHAWRVAAEALMPCDTSLEVVMFDREGRVMGRSGARHVHDSPPDRNLRT